MLTRDVKIDPQLLTAIPLSVIVSNPAYSYGIFRERQRIFGKALAPFPEFKPVVESIIEKLIGLESPDKTVNAMKFRVMNLLKSVSYEFEIGVKATDPTTYPHRKPYPLPYPYIPSLHAIREALELFDIVARQKYTGIGPNYHSDRYMHHFYHLYHSDFIYLPILDDLSLMDFIKTRAIPISFIGVTTEPVFADGYFNSPIDFFMHDANHVRRLQSYFDEYVRELAKQGVRVPEPNILYQQFQSFIDSYIVPNIEIKQGMSQDEIEIRQILAVLHFELLHEYAFVPAPEYYVSAFKHRAGAPSPFEIMVERNFNPDELEKKRLANANLLSGFSIFKDKPGEIVRIRYFFDKGPNFITSAYNKCVNDFYDHEHGRSPDLPPMSRRTPALFLRAARRLINTLNLGNSVTLSDDAILELLSLSGQPALEQYPHSQPPVLRQPVADVNRTMNDALFTSIWNKVTSEQPAALKVRCKL